MRRVMITGSRDWDDWETIYDALTKIKEVMGDIIVVHGGARGADSIAGSWADRFHQKTEVFRADWNTHGKKAGFIRNSEMIKSKPDFVLAFIKNGSKGASGAAELAEKSGIHVKYFLEESE